MRRHRLAAALREVRRHHAEQEERFGQLAAVLENLGPVVAAWQQEAAETREAIEAIEAALERPGIIQRMLARLGWKTAARLPAGE